MLSSTNNYRKEPSFTSKDYFFLATISPVIYSISKALGSLIPYPFLFGLITVFTVLKFWKYLKRIQVPKPDKLLVALGAVSILHAISFSSSSFIEEEHQTWYFIGNTLFFICFLNSVRSSSKETLKQKIGWIPLMALTTFCRRLNQTGDKWVNIPDVGDWLQSNNFYSKLFCGFGKFAVFILVIFTFNLLEKYSQKLLPQRFFENFLNFRICSSQRAPCILSLKGFHPDFFVQSVDRADGAFGCLHEEEVVR